MHTKRTNHENQIYMLTNMNIEQFTIALRSFCPVDQTIFFQSVIFVRWLLHCNAIIMQKKVKERMC